MQWFYGSNLIKAGNRELIHSFNCFVAKIYKMVVVQNTNSNNNKSQGGGGEEENNGDDISPSLPASASTTTFSSWVAIQSLHSSSPVLPVSFWANMCSFQHCLKRLPFVSSPDCSRSNTRTQSNRPALPTRKKKKNCHCAKIGCPID